MVAITTCLSASVFAAEGDKQSKQPVMEPPAAETATDSGTPVRFGLDLEYAGPYVWRGIRITDGAVQQPTAWASYGTPNLGNFRVGLFANMFASKKDLLYKGKEGGPQDRTITPYKGPGSKSLFETNEVKLLLDWNRRFTESFRMNVGYTHMAYSTHPVNYESKKAPDIDPLNPAPYAPLDFRGYKWFDKKSSYGELNLKPSYQWKSLNFFAVGNVVILASSWKSTEEVWNDPQARFDTVTTTHSERWNQQYSFGATYANQASETFAFDATLYGNFANEAFLAKWNKYLQADKRDLPVETSGLYSMNLEVASHFTPTSRLSVSPSVGAELITNAIISNNKMVNNRLKIRGGFLYGGVSSTYAW